MRAFRVCVLLGALCGGAGSAMADESFAMRPAFAAPAVVAPARVGESCGTADVAAGAIDQADLKTGAAVAISLQRTRYLVWNKTAAATVDCNRIC